MYIKIYLIASQCRFLGIERNLFRKNLSLLWTRTNHSISCHGTFHSNILFVGLNSFANKNSLCKSFDENTVCCFGVIMILHKGIKLLIPLSPSWLQTIQYTLCKQHTMCSFSLNLTSFRLFHKNFVFQITMHKGRITSNCSNSKSILATKPRTTLI